MYQMLNAGEKSEQGERNDHNMNGKKLKEAMSRSMAEMLPQTANFFVSTHFYTPTKLWTVVEKLTKNGKASVYVSADCEKGTVKPLFDHNKLAAQMSKKFGCQADPSALGLEITGVTEDGVSFRRDDVIYTFANGRLKRAKLQYKRDWAVSPDGRYAIIRKNHDIYQKNMSTGKTVRLTRDGSLHNGYGERYEGDADYLSDADMGLVRPAGVTFSPDCRRYLVNRLDQRTEGDRYVIRNVVGDTPKPPVLYTFKWSTPPDKSIASQSLYTGCLEDGTLTKPALPDIDVNIFESIRAKAFCSAFTEESDGIVMYDMDRDYQHADVYYCDIRSGSVKKLFSEDSDTFLFFDFHMAFVCTDESYDHYGNTFFSASSVKDTLIWTAERDGYYHICNYSLDGSLRCQITRGAWNVSRIVRVDWDNEIIYFTAYGREKGANHRHDYFYRVGFDGSGLELLTPEQGHHTVNLSPDCQYFVDTVTDVVTPQKTCVRSLASGKSFNLCAAELAPELAETVNLPIELEYEIDGKPVSGLLFLPRSAENWKPGDKKIPIVEYNYGCVQMCIIPTDFSRMLLFGGYAQSLTELGFAQIMMDAPGTPGRSKAYHDQAFRNMGEAAGLGYHVKFIGRLCDEYPMLDVNRVGITGHSGGGYGTIAAMIRYNDFYKAGFASGSCQSLELYSDSLTRRFCGGYFPEIMRRDNCEYQADRLRGRLMIVHGEIDDNVPLACMMRMVDSLIKADKDFDMLILPNRYHEIQSHPYYVKRLLEFFEENL